MHFFCTRAVNEGSVSKSTVIEANSEEKDSVCRDPCSCGCHRGPTGAESVLSANPGPHLAPGKVDRDRRDDARANAWLSGETRPIREGPSRQCGSVIQANRSTARNGGKKKAQKHAPYVTADWSVRSMTACFSFSLSECPLSSS